MQIFVKSAETTFVVNLDENATVQDLKVAIEDKEFIPTCIQRIVKGTTDLMDGSLCDVVFDSDTVVLLLSVNGGMRPKWRKKRMRRLRRKRRKMRQRAR